MWLVREKEQDIQKYGSVHETDIRVRLALGTVSAWRMLLRCPDAQAREHKKKF